MSDASPHAALLDVRTEHDFAAGHAINAANIPLEELAISSHELPARSAVIHVTDADPDRAATAGKILTRRGNPVEIVPLASLALSSFGLSRVRLWSPNPFLVEAIAAIQSSNFPLFGYAPLSLPRYTGGGLGRGSSAPILKDAPARKEPPPQPSPGVPVEGENSSPSSSAPRALDVACGTGRDAVWLALQGLQVDALDHLPDALERATALARRNHVSINAVQKDIEADPTLPAGYDLVCVFRYLHRPLWPALRDSIKPNGYIIYETFHTRTREAGGRPSSPDHLLQTGELAAAFSGFDILISRDSIERDGRIFSSLLARKKPV